MGCEEAVHHAHLVGNQQPKSQAQQTRSQFQLAGNVVVSPGHHCERGSDAHSDDHHAGNGAQSEDQKISNRPVGIPYRGKNEQSHCRRARQPVDNTYRQRPDMLVQRHLRECAIQRCQRRLRRRVGMDFRSVGVGMSVDVIAMGVRM